MQSEVLVLERRLDLEAGTLRLDPGTTKNDEGRVAYITPDLARLLAEQLERIRAVERKLGRIIPFLFPYLCRRAGHRRRDFRKAWRTACTQAGVPGRLVHDFRRTAVRNLERAGVPRSVAMKLTATGLRPSTGGMRSSVTPTSRTPAGGSRARFWARRPPEP